MSQPARRGLSLLFSVLPLGTSACAQIAGIDETSSGGRSSLTMTRYSIGSTIERTPLDFTGLEAVYLVEDENEPDGLRRVRAELSTDAATWTASVPTGSPIMFQTPDYPEPVRRIWNFPSRTLAGLFAVNEHLAPEPAPSDAMFNVAIALESAFGAGEQFSFASIGTWNTRTWTDALTELPAPGATMFTPPPLLQASMTKAPNERPYEKITTADTVLIMRHLPPKLTGYFEAPPFEQTGNDSITGTMTTVVDDQQLAIQLAPSIVAARYAPLRPALSAPVMSWSINAAPGWEIGSNLGPGLHAGSVIQTDSGTLAIPYGNPFVAKGWRSVFTWSTSASRAFTPANQALAIGLNAGLYQVVEPALSSNLDLPAPLPELITLGGTSLSTDGITIRQPAAPIVVSMSLSGGAPPTLYQLDLFELVPNAQNTALERKRVLGFAGVQPEFSIPPEFLEAGKSYSLRASTIVGGYPALADGDLTVRELPMAVAYMDAGVFTVVAP